MPTRTHLALDSDPHCPDASLAAFRLRKLRDEYRDRVVVAHSSLALEYVNS